jgi:hypothetical protein
MELVPDAGGLPGAQATPGGVSGAGAECRGQVAPAAAGIEHEQDAFKRGAVVDRRSSTRPTRWWPGRDQRLEQVPQPIIDQPLLLRPRHDERLDLAQLRERGSDTPGVLRPGLSGADRPPIGMRVHRHEPEQSGKSAAALDAHPICAAPNATRTRRVT